MKSRILAGASALALLGVAGPTFAQDEAASVSEVVVTGSLIRGSREDAALPVDVIGADELAKQGSPSTVELIKSLPASQGVLGDSNQFDVRAQGSEGTGSINLRGLGSTRTLVLLNGRRLANSGFTGTVDTNMIPANAIGRIEVLKDGAAVTYGSDAIAGVVNFITATNFEGFQLDAGYSFIDGSDGDYNVGAKWGWVGDRADVMVAFNYGHRSELSFRERSWSEKPFTENPQGGWTQAANPGTFLGLNNGAFFVDNGCGDFGEFQTVSDIGLPACYFHFTSFDNLVEPEDRYQAYGQINVDLNEKTKLHIDAMFSKADILMRTSPSYALISRPTGVASPVPGQFYIPGTNPGLAAYAAANPEQFPLGVSAGVLPIYYRPFGVGGNPAYDGIGASTGQRRYELARVSGELTGEFDGGIGWNVSLNYSQSMTYGSQTDSQVNRLQYAFRGLGGEGCDPATGTPGVGPCKWFYPMSNSIARNPLTGEANPGFDPALANDPELIRWFFVENWRKYVTRLFVGEAVLNGELPFFELPGGKIGWAAGAQYRLSNFTSSISDGWNLDVNPCIDTPTTGSKDCTVRNGPYTFLGGFNEQDLEQTAYALFTEFQLPITDSLSAQLAARFEDYGGGVGDTFDPKASIRWQANDWLALRGSIGSTFRAPPPTALSGQGTSLQRLFSAGGFFPVDLIGNPNLKPEKAITYNAGAIVRAGGLRATLDYWRFKFDDPLTTDPVADLRDTLFYGGFAGPNHCGDPAYAAIEARFTFNASGCGANNATRLATYAVNGSSIDTSGLDLAVDYDLPWQPWDSQITLGGSATYVIEYQIDAFYVEGVKVADAYDAVGKLNYQKSATPIPQLKGSVYAEFNKGDHNLRLTVNYIDSYRDQRGDNLAPGVPDDIFGPTLPTGGIAVTGGKTIKETVTLDAAYRVFLPADTTLALRVANVFDRDPSFARLDPNYDPFTGNPLGRTVKVSLSKKF